MWSDLRYALRVLRRSKGFAAVAILLLALGIGANSAIFSLAEAMILRPLPVPDSGGLLNLTVFTRGAKVAGMSFANSLSYPEYRDYRDQSRAFAGLAAFQYNSFGYAATNDALAQARFGLLVSGNFFPVFRVGAQAGRVLQPDEDTVPGRDAVVVISDDFWRKDMAARPDAVGQTIYLAGLPFRIIGITEKSFTGVDQYTRPCFYVPLAMAPVLAGKTPAEVLEDRKAQSLMVKGRLRPGVSRTEAAAEAALIAGRLAAAHPEINRQRQATVETELQRRYRQSAPDMILAGVLLALAGIVLLIACANVANLMLSRARTRTREIAVRVAIGAGRSALIRQSLAESLLLAAAGGVLGLLIAQAAADAFSRLPIPAEVPVSLTATVNSTVLLYTLLASLGSALLFGLAPAWQGTRADLATALKAGEIETGRRLRLWGRNTLVVAQVAGSLLLLVCASQFLLGSRALLKADPAYRTSRLLMATFDPGLVRYTQEKAQVFYDRLLERARALPGVRSAALTDGIPTGNATGVRDVRPEGYDLPKGVDTVSVPAVLASPGYFDTMGVPILRGRGFLEADRKDAPQVAVVNESFARKYFPGRDAVGQRLRLNTPEGPLVTVVGVSRQSKYFFVAEPPVEAIYLPLRQHEQMRRVLLVETEGPSGSVAAPLRDAVRALDPGQPMYNVRTVEDFFEMRSVGTLNFISRTLTALALLGLVLALTGLYGLMAYTVTRRRREIGIRIAIGADQALVQRMVLRQALALSGLGVAIGLALSVFASRSMQQGGVMPGFDLKYVLLVALVLMAASALGAWGPARRASRVDPATVMRQD